LVLALDRFSHEQILQSFVAWHDLVCVRVTEVFLRFSLQRGNDLTTPRPELRFRGLQPGDRWCLHVLRFVEALEADMAPQVVLASTHENVLRFVPLESLKRCALDLQ
jgi:uncharacterized protein (DUF2237 family)